MPNGFEQLGASLGGLIAGPNREGAYIEGQEAGAKVGYQKAQTTNALAQAALRRQKYEANQNLAAELGTMMPEEAAALSAWATAGRDPTELVKAKLGLQEYGFRDTAANPDLPIANRQGALMGIEGKPQGVGDIVNAQGLMADVFGNAGISETPFGTANRGAADALAADRNASALLDDEKRLHPEKFKTGLTVNVGQDGSLGDEVVPSYDFGNVRSTFGARGAATNALNTVADVIPGFEQPAPQADRDITALSNLREESMMAGTLAFPGRPTNFIAQRVDELFPKPASIFAGDERAINQVVQLKNTIDAEIRNQERLLPQFENKSTRDKARATTSSLKQLSANYGALIDAFGPVTNGQDDAGQPDSEGWVNKGGIRVREIPTGE